MAWRSEACHVIWRYGQKGTKFSTNVVLKLQNYSFQFQPFRNSPIILPEAKTIYGVGDVGQKYVTPSEVVDEKVGNMMYLKSSNN